MFSAAMQNASLWNTTLSSEDHHDDDDGDGHLDDDDDHGHTHIAYIHDVSLKVIYIIIGTVGVLDNLFVLVIFIAFVAITAKVFSRIWSWV